MHGTLKPLHCACMVADADCVELLLEKGAEVSEHSLLQTDLSAAYTRKLFKSEIHRFVSVTYWS